MDNTLDVQCQLEQGCLNYVYIIKERKLEWRRAHYSKTNYGPLTRLTLFYHSFVIHNCLLFIVLFAISCTKQKNLII